MRRSVGILVIFCLLIFPLSLAYAVDLPRHVDPAVLEMENPFPSKLFLLYGFLFDSITLEDFIGAKNNLASLADVYAPPNTKFVLTRFNELLLHEIDELNLTRVNIDDAVELLRWLEEEEAEEALAEALYHLSVANVTLEELEGAAVQLSSNLRAPSAPLVDGLGDVQLVLERYLDVIRRLREGAELIAIEREQNPLIDTALTVWTDVQQVLVGSSVSVGGRLETVDGEGLAFRTVALKFDGALVEEAVTDSDGHFMVGVWVPYVYEDSSTLWSEFWPEDEDEDVYSPAMSNVIVLNLIYYRPNLEVDGPSWVYPGTGFSLRGRLTHEGEPLQGFEVHVHGFTGFKTETLEDGSFDADLVVPANFPSGLASVRVEALPIGVFGPTEVEFGVDVVRLSSRLWVGGPSWIVSGNELSLEGIVAVDMDPLPGCSIAVKNGGFTASATSDYDGHFDVSLALPFVLFTGRHPYTVTARPAEAWIQPCALEKSVLVVNVYTLIGGPSFAFIAVVYAVSKVSSRPGRKRKEQFSVVEKPASAFEGGVMVEGKPDSLPSIYFGAVFLVSGRTGLYQRPNQTIREYVESVKDGLGDPSLGVFRSLSMLYERWLYGVPFEPDLAEALRLLEELRELLSAES